MLGSASPSGQRVAIGIGAAGNEVRGIANAVAVCIQAVLLTVIVILPADRVHQAACSQMEACRGGIEDVAYQKVLIQQLAAQTSLNVLGIKQ